MSIWVKDNGGGDFERPKAGLHQGVCTNVYGPFQESYEWQGKIITQQKIVVMFELDDRMQEGKFKGQRFTISERFTASLAEKSKLRPFLESWRGVPFTPEELQNFDVEKLVGANAYLNLIEKPKKTGGTTMRIAAVMPTRKDVEKMIPELPRDYAPEWIKKLLGMTEGGQAQASPDHFDDDIPF